LLRRLTESVDEISNVGIYSASQTLRKNMQPRGSRKKDKVPSLNVDELKTNETNNKKCFYQKQGQMHKNCQLALFKTGVRISNLSKTLNRDNKQQGTK